MAVSMERQSKPAKERSKGQELHDGRRAPTDWPIDKVQNTILVYLAGIKWLRMKSGIQWLHADYQPQIHDSIQEYFILDLDNFLDYTTPNF